MKKALKYLMLGVTLVLFLGINRVEALSVEEKWQKIADDLELYSAGEYSVASDNKSITITSNFGKGEQVKFTLEDGAIVGDNKDGLPGSVVSQIIYAIRDMFDYGRYFGDWFLINYSTLSFDKDGFEITGKTSEPYDTGNACNTAGIGTNDMFARMYCNEDTGKIEMESFIIEHVKIDLNRGFVTYDPTYGSSTGTLSVGEKWNKIANVLKERYAYGDIQTVTSDDTSITINDSIRQCKFTLEDGTIIYDASVNKDNYCEFYLSDILDAVATIFNYKDNFYGWFQDHFQNLKLDKDGFEIIGELSDPIETDLECGVGIGGSSVDWFDWLYCNDETNKLVSQYFAIQKVKIDLNRGFVTYDPNYNSSTGEKTKEEAVKVPDTLSNTSTVIMVAAGIFILAGVGIIYYNFRPRNEE